MSFAKTLDSFETALNQLLNPVKPFLPGIARFLLVVTYLEDSIRITQVVVFL
jgi:hypothetical protein